VQEIELCLGMARAAKDEITLRHIVYRHRLRRVAEGLIAWARCADQL
jgi:hypothetical protein